MRAAILICLVLAFLPAGTAFAADGPVTGEWAVHGKISGFSFDLTCRFEQKGQAIGGVCYDGGTQLPHPLTQGEISGSRIRWTYQSSYLFKTFDAAYSGTLTGSSIEGVVTAPGRQGEFTAERRP